MGATDDWRWTLGLLGIAGLALIPVVMVGSIAIRALIESRRARAAEVRRVTLDIPGLGVFSTTDDECWCGEAAGLAISIVSPGRAPSAAQVEQVRTILRDLPKLAEKAEDYLLSVIT